MQEKLDLKHKPLLEKYMAYHSDYMGLEGDFCGLFAWAVYDDVRIIEGDGYLTSYRAFGDKGIYFPPLTLPDTSFAYAVYDTLSKADKNSVIQLAPAHLVKTLDTQLYDIVARREDFDYLYLASDLTNLVGKKFHAKRNHFNKFSQKYDYTFRDYTQDDYKGAIELFDRWLQGQPPSNAAQARFERCAYKRVLNNLEALDAKCAVIEIEGQIHAISIVTINIHGIGIVHFEKADITYDGIYAAINKLTAQRFLSDCTYINRQDDMGLEGLRKAKLSYNPTDFVEKYEIRLKR